MNKWKPLSGELLKMYLQLNIWFCKKKIKKKKVRRRMSGRQEQKDGEGEKSLSIPTYD